MTSKSSTVILPLVLALYAYWQNGRWKGGDAVRLSPFLVLAALASLLAIWTQQLEGAADPQWKRSVPERLITAGNVVWFYLGKLIWPYPLMFVYPKWELNAEQVSSYLGLSAVCVLFLILFWNRHGRARPAFFAFSCFLIALLPVMGLVEHFFLRYSYVGDHFQYLSSAGIVGLVTGVATRAFRRGGAKLQGLGILFGCIVAITLGTLTWNHERVFANDERLWRDTLTKNPSDWLGHNNLGVLLVSQGDFAAGMHHYRESLRINPNYERAHNNLGVILSTMGNHNEAIIHCQEAVRLEPAYADAHYNLGNAFTHQSRYAEAIEHYTIALRLKPDYSEAHNNLGNVLAALGKYTESLHHFKEALRLNPDNVDAMNNLRIIQEALVNGQR
jgi:tetratricopeptide (TPR) repeat protein